MKKGGTYLGECTYGCVFEPQIRCNSSTEVEKKGLVKLYLIEMKRIVKIIG
jgi:hypothetical protein